MKVFILSIALSLPSLAALSFGDASDGDCSWTGGGVISVSQSVWNCQDITVASGTEVRFTGSQAVELRAQGNVNIDGIIDVSAERDGDGITPGPSGGGPGLASGQDAPGSTGGEGVGGANAGSFSFGNGGGGGGATLINPTTDFETEVLGGRGGGAGGDGDNGGTAVAGGAGGAGGGAFILVAKGDIVLSATSFIYASGADGSPGVVGAQQGGGGGGGAGGAVYIVSGSSLTFNGTVDAGKGLGNTTGISGSDGVDGRIRFDAPDGQRNIGGGSTGSVTPSQNAPSQSILDPLAGAAAIKYESDIDYACSYREALPMAPQLLGFLLGLALILGLAQAQRLLKDFHCRRS